MKNEKDGVWTSWNENITHPYKSLQVIHEEKELQESIIAADKVRFFGNKQSSADICAGTEVLLDINSYDQVLHINTTKKEVTVQAGIKLKDLIELIESKGWCIPCLPDINTVTLGGALATGTHGTNGKILAAYMVKCRLVLADGSVKEVNEHDDLMNALRVSLGVLGVFSTITMRCEDIYTLHLKEAPEKDSVWLSNMQQDLKKYDFLRILWLPHTGMGYVIKGHKIEPDAPVTDNQGPSYLKHRRAASKLLYKYSHKIPLITYFANKLLYLGFFRSKKEHKGSLYQATVTKSRGSTLELAEWTISLEKFPFVFKELKSVINSWKNKSFIHIPMDIRFIDNDTSWLSYAYGQNTVTMGCVSRNAESADSYEAFTTIEKIFIKHGGRPHWGKRFKTKDAEFLKLYPKWNDFKTLRKQLDPTNKFLNKYLANLFNETL